MVCWYTFKNDYKVANLIKFLNNTSDDPNAP